MNPYEEPSSNLEKPQEARIRGIQWGSIFLAIVIYFLTERVIQNLPFSPYLGGPSTSIVTTFLMVSNAFLIFFAPWIAAGSLLAWRVRHRWLLHSLIYCVAWTLASIMFVAAISMYSGQVWFEFDLLWQAFGIFLFSLFINTLVMGVPRVFFGHKSKS